MRASMTEMHNPAMFGLIGVICVSVVPSWFHLGLLFSTQDYETTATSPTGQPVTRTHLDTVGKGGRNCLYDFNIETKFLLSRSQAVPLKRLGLTRVLLSQP